jgi:hypothetical protein
MIRATKTLYVDVSRGRNAISSTIESYNRITLDLFEGDAITIRIYFMDYEKDVALALDSNESVVFTLATENSLRSLENDYLCLNETFDKNYDSDQNPYYEGLIELNTQEAIDALGTSSNAECYAEIVIVDTNLGHQTTFQHEARLYRSIAPQTLTELVTPSQHIGSYASARQMMEEIADQRILDLKDGAPLEFDTLYELAHYAQKVRSREIVVGDFNDYIDGKLLADQNLTVAQLGQLAVDTSTYSVTHEPWRPRALEVKVI